jgi:hypothetical protein
MKTFLLFCALLVCCACSTENCKDVYLDNLNQKIDSVIGDEDDINSQKIDQLLKKENPALGFDGEMVTYPDTFNFCIQR